MTKNLMDDMPGIDDLERRASKRIPHFAWEYLASGTGDDRAVQSNLDGLARVQLVPQLLKGFFEPSTETELFGVRYAAPIGIAPVGLTGLIWPGADAALAKAAAEKRIPYTLSTVATEKPEVAGPNAKGMGWFQLYPPREESLRADMIERAKESGFTTLVVTADVPAASRRERQRKARVRVPPVIGPKLVAQSMIHPAWSLGILRNGIPRFRTLEKYLDEATMRGTAGFVGANLGGTLSWEYLAEVRELWDGPLVVKGILDVEDAQRCVDNGADAVQVSNHGGRQLDAVPPAIDSLPAIVDRIGGQVPVLFDSGVRSGLDVARAIALGASFVFCGRAFMFGLGAIGEAGPGHAYEILREGLVNTMSQVGCLTMDELASRLDRNTIPAAQPTAP
ncbi:MAG: alpha-hydroxy acid oxidase [Acidimicrobiales bacterium]